MTMAIGMQRYRGGDISPVHCLTLNALMNLWYCCLHCIEGLAKKHTNSAYNKQHFNTLVSFRSIDYGTHSFVPFFEAI